MTSSTNFAKPEPAAQQHSDRLLALIQHHIDQAGGKIRFSDYMQLCLYSPGLGYYSAGQQKFGPKGDFTTAPEISSLFSRSLARQIYDVTHQLPRSDLLEFGAGTGKMAGDILLELDKLNALPEHYYIIEASADLREKQEYYLQNLLPDLFNKFVWLSKLPEQFSGVIVANEVCDAMPIHRIQLTENSINEVYIENRAGQLSYCLEAVTDPQLMDRVKQIQTLIENYPYLTEINLAAEAWLTSLAGVLQQGAIFIIDYGYPRSSYYHPQRSAGTLMCYYQHQGHDDPLIMPGLQDITSHIDFTSLAETAQNNGLDVDGFQSQADFLLAAGITELLDPDLDEFAALQQKTELKRLTLPSAMGEDFKVLTLTKNLSDVLQRIQLADRRHSL